MGSKKNTYNKEKDLGEWIIFGLLGGTTVGILLGNLPLGMIVGMCVGIFIGSIRPG